MALRNAIEKAILEAFKQNNQLIASFEPIYADARRIVAAWGEEQLKNYRRSLPDSNVAIEVLEKKAWKEKDDLSRRLQGKELEIEMALNVRDRVDLYIPLAPETPTTLEADIFEHVAGAFYTFDPTATTGRIGDYLALTASGNEQDIDELVKIISNEMPEAMRLAKINLSVQRLSVPLSATALINVPRYVDINLTPSAVEYKLIPLRKAHTNFFPRYKRGFIMRTPTGDIRMWVTSRVGENNITLPTGNYMTSTGDGALGQVFESMQIKAGDSLRIIEITPMQRYELIRNPAPS